MVMMLDGRNGICRGRGRWGLGGGRRRVGYAPSVVISSARRSCFGIMRAIVANRRLSGSS